MFVVAIRPRDRAVVIGPREALLGRGVTAREVNWIADVPPLGTEVSVQVRHRARAVPAVVVRADGGEVELAFEEPVAAVTPGQSLVLYDGDRVLGGGVIEAALGQRAALPVLAASAPAA
jgi:tRNA-specific 2-thiouridylase